ncbi:MAG: arginine--tRNA ligase [Myxococcales bacterium]|nr:arginine--tRNA ligase [Myxococcales bacterium]
MSTVAAHLTALVQQAAERAGFEGVTVDGCLPTKDASLGDYQSNTAFRLAKSKGMKPRDAAEALRANFPEDPAVTGVEVAGPGFLNLSVDDAWLAAAVRTVASPGVGAGKTVVIDYSSPNIAKRMHIGHLRSTIIGNALDRMHRWLGYRVIADNHVGDWGTPFGKLIVAWQEWRDEAAYAEDPVGELQRLYQLADEKMEADPSLLERARAETVKLQQRDPETLALWQRFVDASMAEFDVVYGRLGIRFDEVLGESAYQDRLDPLVAELLERGIAVESQGAIVVPLEEKGLTDHPLLIQKADGAKLYGTTDLATIEHRLATWAPTRVLYVVDTRQQLHFRCVFAAARKMGSSGDFVHVWFGMLKFPGGAVASSRKGVTANLLDVLDTAAERAYAVITEKSPELPEEERRAVAEVVGTATIKYFDLSQNPQSDITFDWDRALAHDGGSAVYLQYAYARLHSILRAGGAAETPPDVLPAHTEGPEKALLRLVARLPEVVQSAAETCKPNLLAEYLETVARAVGPFYEHCPVLKDGVAPEVRATRLSLVSVVANTLEVGLGLLGIGVVPRL